MSSQQRFAEILNFEMQKHKESICYLDMITCPYALIFPHSILLINFKYLLQMLAIDMYLPAIE